MESRRDEHFAIAAALFSMAAIGFVLYRFPPTEYGFYPRCPVYEWTGLQCPGCGATRALAALVHGHFADALRWNGLIVFLLPIFAAWAVALYHKAATAVDWAWPKVPNRWVATLMLITGIFTIVRNFV